MGSLAVSRFLYERRIANIKRKSSESLAKEWGRIGVAGLVAEGGYKDAGGTPFEAQGKPALHAGG